MAKDLRSYISYLKENTPAELVSVSRPVDSKWEVTALIRALRARCKFPAVLFEKI